MLAICFRKFIPLSSLEQCISTCLNLKLSFFRQSFWKRIWTSDSLHLLSPNLVPWINTTFWESNHYFFYLQTAVSSSYIFLFLSFYSKCIQLQFLHKEIFICFLFMINITLEDKECKVSFNKALAALKLKLCCLSHVKLKFWTFQVSSYS